MPIEIHYATLILCLLIATYTDFKTRRINNSLILAGMFIGFMLALQSGGIRGLGEAIVGGGLGLILLLPLYAFGKMGAGDIKLLALCGVFVGPSDIAWVTLYSLIAGGFLALVLVFYYCGLRNSFHTLIGTITILKTPGGGVQWKNENSVGKMKMPYAAAILVGTLWTFVV